MAAITQTGTVHFIWSVLTVVMPVTHLCLWDASIPVRALELIWGRKNIILNTSTYNSIFFSISHWSICDYEVIVPTFCLFSPAQCTKQTCFAFSSTSLFVWSILAVLLSVTHMAVHDTVEAVFTRLGTFAAFQRGWSGTGHIDGGLAEREICI